MNAYRRGTGYTTPADRARIEAVDPLFGYSLEHHPSFGRACATGATVVSVDHLGHVRRCHFVDTVIGHLEDPDLERRLGPRPRPNEQCGCHIAFYAVLRKANPALMTIGTGLALLGIGLYFTTNPALSMLALSREYAAADAAGRAACVVAGQAVLAARRLLELSRQP